MTFESEKICDRCKRSVESFELKFKVGFPIRRLNGELTGVVNNRTVELCRNCADDLNSFVNNSDRCNVLNQILERYGKDISPQLEEDLTELRNEYIRGDN